jgi:hypothetical protein
MRGPYSLVWAAMLACVAVFFVIGIFAAPGDSKPTIPGTLATILIVATIAFSVLNFLLVSAAKNPVAQLGVFNSVAFYGLLLALIGFPLKTYVFFYIAALIGIILKRPVENPKQ